MMKRRTLTGGALLLGLLLVALSGCEQGTAEKAGASVDATVDNLGESLEEAGKSIEDAGRDARD